MKRIALFGFGGVGQALLTIIRNQNLPIEICFVFDRSYHKKKDILKNIPASDDINIIKNIDNIDLIVELMGGLSTALFIIRESLDRGIPVVTANKAVLAEHGYALFNKAIQNKTQILFEAAVAGAIPIVQNIKEIFCHEKINVLQSILNGTTNYILSQMRLLKKEQSIILKQAQQLGFAEADPTLDINGVDASQKLALISSLIQHKWVDYHRIYTRGIQGICLADILFAERMNYQIKLISSFQAYDNYILTRTEPVFVDHQHPLYGVDMENNAISFTGKYSNNHLLLGKGAGHLPTAYAVLTDILRISKSGENIKLEEEYETLKGLDNVQTPIYLRISVKDQIGILEKISQILSSQKISISSIIQNKPTGENILEDKTEIFIITHSCKRTHLLQALELFYKEKYIFDKLIYIAIQETNITS